MHSFQKACESTLQESGIKRLVERYLGDERWMEILKVLNPEEVVQHFQDEELEIWWKIVRRGLGSEGVNGFRRRLAQVQCYHILGVACGSRVMEEMRRLGQPGSSEGLDQLVRDMELEIVAGL